MKADWNVSGLLIEGVSGSGKTELLRALLESDRIRDDSGLSMLVLTEHQTQRVLEKKDREMGLVPDDHLRLLERHVSYVEALNEQLASTEWCRGGQTAHRIRFVLERFHLTHVVQYPHMDWSMVESLDRRLADLGGTLCLLVADEATLAGRLFENRDEAWLSYVRRFGAARSDVVAHFLAQQEELLQLAERSRLDCIRFDSSARPTAHMVSVLLDRLSPQ